MSRKKVAPVKLSPDDWVPGRTVWLGGCQSAHNVTSSPTDKFPRRSRANAHPSFQPKLQTPNAVRHDSKTTTQLAMHLFIKLTDAAVAKDLLKKSIHRVQCCSLSSTKQRDESKTRSLDDSTGNESRFRLPEPTCLPKDPAEKCTHWSLALMNVGRTMLLGRNRPHQRFRRWLTIRMQHDINVSPNFQCLRHSTNCFHR